ncbi:hypothetical protein FRC04_001584 [Tulasnella sp. 424]|nr:hypothetical protein FRC04_001584 [Tulasnella sp. 424]KAG8968632.1 hypothetical protein FRC05_001484 [Tulasnella sp. 425]
MSYSADINEHTLYPIPLNDSSVVLSGKALFNSSCGGTIYLPTLSDSVTFTFTGTGVEVDYIPMYLSSEASLIVDNSVQTTTALDSFVGAEQPLNCSDVRRQWMGIGLDRVLKYGRHSATIKAENLDLEEVGAGLLISKINYLNEPEPTTTSYSSEATGVTSGSSSGSPHLKVTVGVPVGAIAIFIIVLVAIYGCWKRRQNRKSTDQIPGAVSDKPSEETPPRTPEPSPGPNASTSLTIQTPALGKGAPTTAPATLSLSTQATSPSLVTPTEGAASQPMSAEQIAQIQTLTRQGLSSTQIAAVLESMRSASEPSSGAQRAHGATDGMGRVDDPPPQYDFKDRTT